MKTGIKMSVIMAGILGFILSGCPKQQDIALKPTKEGLIQMMTYNIRYGTADDGQNSWKYRKEALFKQIEALSPDVAGLQEALEFQVQEICQNLPEYGSVGVGRDDGEKEGEQCCILYRKDRFKVIESGTFWFSDTPEVVASKSWGNTLPRICTWVQFAEAQFGNKFYLYNVHLDHQSATSRLKSVELLARMVAARKTAGPFIITGDFNCGPESPPIHYLLGQADERSPVSPVDVLAAVRPEQKDTGTFHGFEGRSDGARIDFILTDTDIRIQDAGIDLRQFDGRYTSDHYPVTAWLGLF